MADLEVCKRVVLVGAGAAGKDYLRQAFVASGVPADVSVTDRKMRLGEEEGTAYHFVTSKEFDKAVESGAMKQHIAFGPHRYGTLQESWDRSTVFIMSPRTLAAMSSEDRRSCVVVYLQISKKVRTERLKERLQPSGPERDPSIGFASSTDTDVVVEKRLADDAQLFPREFNNFDVRIVNPAFNPMKCVDYLMSFVEHETESEESEEVEVD